MRASDQDKWTARDGVCVILSPCDPPSLDHFRAITAAFDQGGHSTVWLCPMFLNDAQAERARLCCQVLCSEYWAAERKQVTTCTVMLDKKLTDLEDFKAWFNERFSFTRLTICMLSREATNADVVVAFSGDESLETRKWTLAKHLASPADLSQRIAKGADESRWFPRALWDFLLEKGLYKVK